jgi:hypothetical protein
MKMPPQHLEISSGGGGGDHTDCMVVRPWQGGGCGREAKNTKVLKYACTCGFKVPVLVEHKSST